MKVLSISFWGGIITAVLFFITMLCFAWDDGRMHEKEIKNSIWKYILFLLMGMITSVFCLVFVFAYFTKQNHLRLKNPIKRKRHPDEIKDRENYRRMKGIPVPNYTINKGMLAENMATAAVEYPFTLAENMVGRPEEL